MAGITKDGGGGHPLPQASAPGSEVHFTVTPDNVVDLAVLFQQAADRLRPLAAHLRRDLRIREPWLGDPVSEWAWQKLNNHLVDDPNSLANVYVAAYGEHQAAAEELRKIADEYGKIDELNAALVHKADGTR